LLFERMRDPPDHTRERERAGERIARQPESLQQQGGVELQIGLQ